MSSPNTAARDAKFKERFLRRFSTKVQGRVSPNHEEPQSQAIGQAEEPPKDATILVAGSRPPSDESPPPMAAPAVIVEEATADREPAGATAPRLASGREIQRQLGIDTPITADDIHEYLRQQSRASSTPTRVPSNGSGPSFLSNSKQFVVEQCTFVDASHKTFESTESVGKCQSIVSARLGLDLSSQPFSSSARG